MKNTILGICMGLTALVGSAAESALGVPTLVVGAADWAGAAEVDGRVEPVRQATVAAQLPGHVLELAVRAGDRVRSGQKIARIDARDAQAGLAASEAGVVQAEAGLRNAKLSAERTRELRRQGFVSQAAQDAADVQLQAAEAGLRQAQAARTQAALARGYANVTAPFDGVVLATHVQAGDLAGIGSPIVTIYAPGELRAVVSLPTSRAGLLRAGGAVEIELADGRWIAPVRTTELPAADSVSQTVDWRLDLDAKSGALVRPGQSVRVRLSGGTGSRRLALPQSAVLQRGELTGVYAVQEGRFVLKAVRLGARSGDRVEVLAGLRAGERVAAEAVKAGLAGAAPQ